MNVEIPEHDDIRFMCTDSEKNIAKLEWLYEYRRPRDPGASQKLETLLQAMKDMHATLEQMYRDATGKKFESKIEDYRKKLRLKLAN